MKKSLTGSKMFNGIVEETGTIQTIVQSGNMVTFHIAASTIAGKVKPNDSIAVDGVCLTVTDIDAQRLKFDLVPETLKKTTLGFKSEGDFVNLQRSLGIQDRIDGHFVQGHVDTVAKIATIKDFGENREMVFEIPPEFNSLIIPRGSIAIDGISLTIAECIGNQFKVAVIPHTLKLTTMKHYRAGGQVNVEFDMIGKYILKALEYWKENPEK